MSKYLSALKSDHGQDNRCCEAWREGVSIMILATQLINIEIINTHLEVPLDHEVY